MKKVVKKYQTGGTKPKGVSKQVASVTGLPEGSYVAKSKSVSKSTTKAPVKKNTAVGKATAYKTIAAPYISSSSPAYKKLTPEQRNKNTQAQLKHDMTGSSSDFSGKTKVAYNKNNNTKTIINYKADGTKQVKVINYSKAAAAKKAPVKTPVKQPVKTAYDVLKDKQAVIKNPRIGTPVKGTVTPTPKKSVTVKKSTVKPVAVKAAEEQVTPLAFKKVSDFAPIKTGADAYISATSKNTSTKPISDRVRATAKKSIAGIGERLDTYNNANRPVANTTTTPTESAPTKVSLMDKIKSNIAKRKMKKMAKLSEQVGQSRAMGSYAQPTMKKGGSTKSFPDFSKDGKVTKKDILIAKGVIPKAKKGGIAKKLVKAQYGIETNKNYPSGTPTIAKQYNPAKINVKPGKKKLSYNEVFKTKKK